MSDAKKIIVWKGFWTVEDVLQRPRWLFIFGDNDEQQGCGGQAVIRHCKNVVGVPTKRSPGWHDEDFYTDDDYEAQCEKIQSAITRVIERSAEYDRVVFPGGGLGTGLADLARRAPRTMDFLNEQVLRLRDI